MELRMLVVVLVLKLAQILQVVREVVVLVLLQEPERVLSMALQILAVAEVVVETIHLAQEMVALVLLSFATLERKEVRVVQYHHLVDTLIIHLHHQEHLQRNK
jgi:hypothetical protein